MSPITHTDTDGNEQEVFTPEEVQAQKDEAVEAFKTDNPDKTEELTQAQSDLDEAKEKLVKLGEKELNFGKAREEANEKAGKKVEEAESRIKELEASFDEKLGTVKKEVLEGVNVDHYNDILKTIAGDDEEKKKKIEFQYKTTLAAVIPTTKAEITKKLIDADMLANPPETQDAMSTSVISSGGVSRINTSIDDKSFSSEDKEIGTKLGLSEEDYKKYGNK